VKNDRLHDGMNEMWIVPCMKAEFRGRGRGDLVGASEYETSDCRLKLGEIKIKIKRKIKIKKDVNLPPI
jgi:hypothetical protein